MSKTRFYDRDGAPIEKDQWAELRKDPGYVDMKVYDNGKVKVTIKWLGKVVSPDNMDAEYWPLYELEIQNRAGDVWANDPNSGETFGRFEYALTDYQDFLLNWTDSAMEDLGKGEVFVEADDNLAALPAAPDRNTPESVVAIGDDGVEGAW